jgi:hypothetical protein
MSTWAHAQEEQQLPTVIPPTNTVIMTIKILRLMITSILTLMLLHLHKCNLYLLLKQDHQVKLRNLNLKIRQLNILYNLKVQLNSKNH